MGARPLVRSSACALALALTCEYAYAQLAGTLRDDAGQALAGATVLAVPTGGGTVSDLDGAWALDADALAGVDSLRFGYVGYAARSFAVGDLAPDAAVVLSPQSFDVVTVTAERAGNSVSTLDPRNVESITSTELQKAPCCNLGESFETNAAVDVSYRDAATGTREMQLLGLRGIYNQLLVEKRPTGYGIGAPQFLDYVAGTWVDGIQIGKGASSVQTGPNALSGQVNTELVKPRDAPPLFANAFASGFGRVEGNVHLAKPWNDRHVSGLLLHGSSNPRALDRDGNQFYDQPGRQTYSGVARHFYTGGDWVGQANLWGVRDRREAGETSAGAADNERPGDPWRVTQANDRVEAFAKTGYVGFARPVTSVGVIASYTAHDLDNDYAGRRHVAQQRSAYANLLFASYLGTTEHRYTVGASLRRDAYRETYAAEDYDRTERIAGLFAEYTYDYERPAGKTSGLYGFSVIGGIRVDDFSRTGRYARTGAQVLPRVNVKVNPTAALALRVSAGRAYLSQQILSENVVHLASDPDFVVEGDLPLTTGWNYGAAAAQNFRVRTTGGAERDGQFSVDAYLTRFDELVVLDRDSDYPAVRAYASADEAYTLSLLASVRLEVASGLDLKLAGRYVDSRRPYRDAASAREPFLPRWRGLLTADYEVPSARWRFNGNLQVLGAQRVPGFPSRATGTDAGLDAETPAFALVAAQVTYVATDRLEVYAGGENLTDYRQTDAVIGSRDPTRFAVDPSQVYAPLTGAMPYVGLRYTLAE